MSVVSVAVNPTYMALSSLVRIAKHCREHVCDFTWFG